VARYDEQLPDFDNRAEQDQADGRAWRAGAGAFRREAEAIEQSDQGEACGMSLQVDNVELGNR
jgi:hypothetical protein